MKIVGIYGSPRPKGNSAQLMDALLTHVETLGGTTARYHMNTIKVRGCQACYSCRKEGHEKKCAVRDDMNPILDDVFQADGVVLASPIYMWAMTAQAKLFTDRLMPVLKPDYSSWLTGQKMLTVFTQGQPDVTKFSPYVTQVNTMFSFLGFRTIEPLVFGGLRNIDDILRQPEAFEKIQKAAEALLANS